MDPDPEARFARARESYAAVRDALDDEERAYLDEWVERLEAALDEPLPDDEADRRARLELRRRHVAQFAQVVEATAAQEDGSA